MTSSSTQFAPSRRMDTYEPFHQIGMWEDTFKSDIISPNTAVSMIAQTGAAAESKPDYPAHETLKTSGNQASKYISDKIQRRLAQNREAARKSRLRKKAYVQQLESSRLKLAQLEQEIQRTRQQGVQIGCALDTFNSEFCGAPLNSGIVAFEMEYGHWVEEQRKKNCELRNVLQAQIGDVELTTLVESCLSHYYDLFRMKADAAKADVFYLMSGVWRTSVERYFHWIGGFRPSELLNILVPQLEPLTDQQQAFIKNLRHSCQQAEDALSQGMDKLQQTLALSVAIDPTASGSYSHMAAAIEKLEALEGFVNQADHLRQQTLTQMSRILTSRQAARGLLALGEYFHRLRAISSLWSARPREPA